MTNLSTFLGPNQVETNVKLATNCDIALDAGILGL
jgi:hypothetical protein